MKHSLTALFAGLFLIFSTSFSVKENVGKGKMLVDFMPGFSGQELILQHQLYYLSNGDSLYLDRLRFYISGLQLRGKRLVFSENDRYHLLDAEEARSLRIDLSEVPAGDYDTLRFCIGTDSLVNVSGAQSGDLDPIAGMYWAWNSGYINVKMEGRSSACQTLHHAFEFHLGGYLPPYPTLRQVILPLRIRVLANQTASIRVEADLMKFFDRLDIRTTNQVTIPGQAAAQMADYFQNIFRVK